MAKNMFHLFVPSGGLYLASSLALMMGTDFLTLYCFVDLRHCILSKLVALYGVCRRPFGVCAFVKPLFCLWCTICCFYLLMMKAD